MLLKRRPHQLRQPLDGEIAGIIGEHPEYENHGGKHGGPDQLSAHPGQDRCARLGAGRPAALQDIERRVLWLSTAIIHACTIGDEVLVGMGAIVLDGGVNLRDLETQMNWHLPRNGGVETLAGFLLTRLGKIPTGAETVDFEGRRFTVLEMSDHRISQVRVERLETPTEG